MKYEYKIEFETSHPEWIIEMIDEITNTLRKSLSDKCTKIVTTFNYQEDNKLNNDDREGN
jgi:hypothetical protein